MIVDGTIPLRAADPGARGAVRAGVVGATGAVAVAFASLVFTHLTVSLSPGNKSIYFCATDRLP